MYDSIDLKEDIRNYLEENKMEFADVQIELIAEELSDRIESAKVMVERDSSTYKKLMVQAIRDVANRTKGINYTEVIRDVVEDDYSEESDAEFRL